MTNTPPDQSEEDFTLEEIICENSDWGDRSTAEKRSYLKQVEELAFERGRAQERERIKKLAENKPLQQSWQDFIRELK